MAERARGWLRARPIGADALLALLVFVVSLVPFVNDGPFKQFELTPFAGFLLVSASGCLVLRRRHPWWVWGLAAGIGAIGVAVNEGPTPVFIPAIVALYSLAARADTALAVAATFASALVPAALIVVTGPFGVLDSSTYELIRGRRP